MRVLGLVPVRLPEQVLVPVPVPGLLLVLLVFLLRESLGVFPVGA
jgi:hypothetical protein